MGSVKAVVKKSVKNVESVLRVKISVVKVVLLMIRDGRKHIQNPKLLLTHKIHY